MAFYLKSNHLTSAISVTTLAIGLSVGGLAPQKSLAQTTVNGAGATFPAPLYGNDLSDPNQQDGWFDLLTGDTWTYAERGSGQGLVSYCLQVPPPLPGETVPRPYSFSGTDTPLYLGSGSAVAAACGTNLAPPARYGLPVQVPVVLGAITISYNTAAQPATINLTRADYCGIFNGTVTSLNGQSVTIARRFDSSGTTLIFSSHLEAACPDWNRGVGSVSLTEGTSCTVPPAPGTVCWPSNNVSGTGNQGVADQIEAASGRVGYIENGTRLERESQNRPLRAAVLQNRAGTFIDIDTEPLAAATTAAFEGTVNIDPSNTGGRVYRLTLGLDPAQPSQIGVPDPTASNAYPIVGATYMLFYGDYSPNNSPVPFAGQRLAIVNSIRNAISTFTTTTPIGFFSTQGDQIAINKGYAPLPTTIKTEASRIVRGAGSSRLPCVNF